MKKNARGQLANGGPPPAGDERPDEMDDSLCNTLDNSLSYYFSEGEAALGRRRKVMLKDSDAAATTADFSPIPPCKCGDRFRVLASHQRRKAAFASSHPTKATETSPPSSTRRPWSNEAISALSYSERDLGHHRSVVVARMRSGSKRRAAARRKNGTKQVLAVGGATIDRRGMLRRKRRISL